MLLACVHVSGMLGSLSWLNPGPECLGGCTRRAYGMCLSDCTAAGTWDPLDWAGVIRLHFQEELASTKKGHLRAGTCLGARYPIVPALHRYLVVSVTAVCFSWLNSFIFLKRMSKQPFPPPGAFYWIISRTSGPKLMTRGLLFGKKNSPREKQRERGLTDGGPDGGKLTNCLQLISGRNTEQRIWALAGGVNSLSCRTAKCTSCAHQHWSPSLPS